MGSWSTLDLWLLAIAGLMAVGALVRLMRARHQQLLSQFRDKLQRERVRQLMEEKRQKQASPGERKAS